MRFSRVANAEACVNSINLPRFVRILTAPYTKLALRKALWLASFVLFKSSQAEGTVPEYTIVNVLHCLHGRGDLRDHGARRN